MHKDNSIRLDNRDSSTTWIWIQDNNYVEVNPWDLLENLIENLPEELNPDQKIEIVRKLRQDIETELEGTN